ncbi:hypothetical protein [Cupriavidus necator]
MNLIVERDSCASVVGKELATQGGAWDRLRAVDKQLARCFAGLDGIAADFEWKSVCVLSDEAKIAEQAYPGLYLIEVCTTSPAKLDCAAWLRQFKEGWDLEEYRHAFTSTTKKIRMSMHSELKEWMPLYLGKSMKISKRVQEHIELKLGHRTFALKLKARGLNPSNYRLHTVSLAGLSHYDCLAPVLELASRKLINPLVGKQ